MAAIRRIVTGHDTEGRSVVRFDTVLQRRLGSACRGVTDLWSTDCEPVDSTKREDRLALPFSLVPSPRIDRAKKMVCL